MKSRDSIRELFPWWEEAYKINHLVGVPDLCNLCKPVSITTNCFRLEVPTTKFLSSCAGVGYGWRLVLASVSFPIFILEILTGRSQTTVEEVGSEIVEHTTEVPKSNPKTVDRYWVFFNLFFEQRKMSCLLKENGKQEVAPKKQVEWHRWASHNVVWINFWSKRK